MINLYIKRVAGLLSILIFTSCISTYHKDTGMIFPKEYTLKHKAYDTELLISNGRIVVIDTFLILVSNQRDSFCMVYSIPNNMKEIYGYGHIGNAPKEFLQPLLTYSYNNTIGINELSKNELVILQLMKEDDQLSIIEQTRLKAPYKMKKGELVPPDYYFSRLDNSHFVSLLCAEDGRFFSLFDSTLTHLDWFGESPIPEKLPVIATRKRLKGRIAACDGTMVFTTSDMPYLACYQFKEEKMQKQWSFFFDQTYYEIQNDDLLFSKEKSFGQVLNLKIDAQYIYILYLDQLLSEYNYMQTEKSFANKVLVFDHEGNAVAKLHLDCRVNEISISNDQTKLYGIAQLPEPILVEFDIPKELTNKDKNYLNPKNDFRKNLIK